MSKTSRFQDFPSGRFELTSAAMILLAAYLIVSLIDWSIGYRGDFSPQPAVSFVTYLYDYQWPAIVKWFGDLI